MLIILFIMLAIVVVVHGSLIVFWPPGGDWQDTVRWYRRSKHLSWAMLLGALVLAIAIPSYDGTVAGYPLAASIRDAVRQHPFVSGTILISLVLSVVLALLEHMWINPMQRSSTRPGGVFYAWFIVTFFVSLAIGASGHRLLPTQDSTPEPIEARILETESLLTKAAETFAAAEDRLSELTSEHNTKQEEAKNAPDAEKKSKQDIADEAARKLRDAQRESNAAKANLTLIQIGLDLLRDARERLVVAKSLTSKRGDDFVKQRLQLREWTPPLDEFEASQVSMFAREWFTGAVSDLRHVQDRVAAASAGSQLLDTLTIVTLGALYALWTLSLLYRRIIDGDRLVGGTARTLALKPLGGSRHPAQCVVVGPRHSGKTELLKSVDDCTYPPTAAEDPRTLEPVEARLAKHIDYDVSVVDCGGEFVGDQLDLLTNLRTDCLVVVLCASHLTTDDPSIIDRQAWDISRIHAIVSESYDINLNGSQGSDEPESEAPTSDGLQTIGRSCIAFFQAIYYATNRAGGRGEKSLLRPSAHDLVAQVSRVIVVLNHRDRGTTDEAAYRMVPLDCLEELAFSIYRRCFRHGGEPKHDVTAAIKVRLTPQNDRLHAVPEEYSSVLKSRDGSFDWARAFAGDWPDKPPISTRRSPADASPEEVVVSPTILGGCP